MLQDFINGYHNKSSRASTILITLATIAGLVLSIMYLYGVCTEACSEAATFKILGLNFSLFGVVFFTAAFVSIIIRTHYPAANLLLLVFFFSAAGAELHFIWLQKYVIGTWCPICLSIATSVYCGCAVLLYETLRSRTMRNNFKRILIIVAAMTIGITTSILGVAKESQATPDYFLGKKKSAVTVYFVSDWFCPACRTLEPKIDEIYAHVSKEARVAFIDLPIHPETHNYTPYNLQFLAFEKTKYPQLRAALSNLAKKTKSPTPEQVQAAIDHLGVKLRQTDYADILYGLQSNMTTYKGYGVNSTPSVIVVHEKNKKQKILVGGVQITLPSIQAAILEVSK